MPLGEPAPPEVVFKVVLSGLAHGPDLDDIAPDVGVNFREHNLYPGDVLLDLAADIIQASGASRDRPLDPDQMRRRLLPEDRAHNCAQHYKAEYAIRAAAMIAAGVDPALLDNAGRWRMNDLWHWSLEAVVVYARAAAEHADVSVADICARVAERHGISL